MQKNEKESLERTLIEVLKESNLKQAEIEELHRNVQKLEKDVDAYKKMYESYKEAADDRWERLKFYEENKLAKLACSMFIRLKKKEINNQLNLGINNKRDSIIGKYYSLYTQEEKADFNRCRAELQKLVYKPLISLVIPVYNTDLQLLEELYISLCEQIYGNWEVCFANGSRDNKELDEQLKKYAEKDNRVKYKLLEKNGGISYNTNQAFEMASGEYIGMVDHDDLLSPDALAEVVIALNTKKNLDFVYSDQDKVDEKTRYRFGALYKPFWSKELLYSGNYITHFSVVKSSLLKEIGLWDSSTDGAQDWDLFLKIAEKTDRIYAIPKVLYHWRTAPTSTALSMDTKNYAAEAQLRSLQNHFDRMGYNAKVRFSRPKDLEVHVKWNHPQEKLISVIIYDEGKNHNIDDYLWFFDLSLNKRLKEIIFVSAEQERLDMVSKADKKILLERGNCAKGYNVGAEAATGNVLIFSTDSALPYEKDTYHELTDWALNPELGVVGPKVIYKNGYVNSIGMALNVEEPVAIFHNQSNEPGVLTYFGTSSWYRNVNAMEQCCFAIEKSKFNQIGGFNEEMKELAVLEWNIRVGKKYRNMINPFAVIQSDANMAEMIKNNYLPEYRKILQSFEMPDVDKYYNSKLMSK